MYIYAILIAVSVFTVIFLILINVNKIGKKSRRELSRNLDVSEYKVILQLARLSHEYKRIDDFKIKRERGFSKISHIIISKYGIFVIDTKDCTGTILGDEKSKYWHLIKERQKEAFYNPIWQNKANIKAIQELLADYKKDFYIPMLVFNNNCVFNDKSIEADIIRDEQVSQFIITNSQNEKLSINDVKKIYKMLKDSQLEKLSTRKSVNNIKDNDHKTTINKKRNNSSKNYSRSDNRKNNIQKATS